MDSHCDGRVGLKVWPAAEAATGESVVGEVTAVVAAAEAATEASVVGVAAAAVAGGMTVFTVFVVELTACPLAKCGFTS